MKRIERSNLSREQRRARSQLCNYDPTEKFVMEDGVMVLNPVYDFKAAIKKQLREVDEGLPRLYLLTKRRYPLAVACFEAERGHVLKALLPFYPPELREKLEKP